MAQGIYAGLTDAQAFNVMMATMECKRELPVLERWSRRLHLRTGVAVTAAASIALWAVALANNFSGSWIIAGSSILILGIGLTITWWLARRKEHRRDYLRALATGLEQLKDAAERKPGANAADLLAAMPDA